MPHLLGPKRFVPMWEWGSPLLGALVQGKLKLLMVGEGSFELTVGGAVLCAGSVPSPDG